MAIPYNMYDQVFTDGDRVIIVDTKDRMWSGELYSHIDHIELYKPNGFIKRIMFDDVRFIAQEGFSVRSVRSPFIHECTENRDKFREYLKVKTSDAETTPKFIGFGDPFEIDNLAVAKPIIDFKDEALLCHCNNGTQAMLYHFESVFDWG